MIIKSACCLVFCNSMTDKEIDNMVYELSDDEIKIVEGK